MLAHQLGSKRSPIVGAPHWRRQVKRKIFKFSAPMLAAAQPLRRKPEPNPCMTTPDAPSKYNLGQGTTDSPPKRIRSSRGQRTTDNEQLTMDIYCTRPGCSGPVNSWADLDDTDTLKSTTQRFCRTCGMPLILAERYLPLKLLGRGGFGTAFLARDRYTPAMRPCVVKQFQPASNLKPQQMAYAQELFEREAAVLEQLGNEHAQIPNLFAFFSLSVGQPGPEVRFFYLVQEFIDGQTLEQELQQKGRYCEAEVVQILEQILPVLQFVHERGSIHRDIKPSNIIRGADDRLYLLDFGAVKQVSTGPLTSSTGIYSAGFAPPEQIGGLQVFPSTDLYALAVTCLILLTGKETSDLFDSNHHQWNWKNYARVSSHLAQVLDRMLLLTPHERFANSVEVMNALTPISPTVRPALLFPAAPQWSSTLELLGAAAFTGFEAALLFIALHSLLDSPAISMGIWGMILGGLIYIQSRRWIEKTDLLIVAGITLAMVLFFPFLRYSLAIEIVLVVSILAGASMVAIIALFRLIYGLLSRIL